MLLLNSKELEFISDNYSRTPPPTWMSVLRYRGGGYRGRV
jgi:hypothetical protein